MMTKMMKIHVVFEFPNVKDIDSGQADAIIDCLSIDLRKLAEDIGCDWFIDDVTE
jgi:hypothetical protein